MARKVQYMLSQAYNLGYDDGYKDGLIEQKQIDDEEYRKDMQYINIKKQELIDKACELIVDIVEDLMARYCETWSEENKKKTLENIRKTMEG